MGRQRVRSAGTRLGGPLALRRTFPPHLVQLVALNGDMDHRTYNSRLLRAARAARRANAGVGYAKYGLVENPTWETEGLVRQVAAA